MSEPNAEVVGHRPWKPTPEQIEADGHDKGQNH